ncbi:predicted protein [Chaetoceros tenuissimus]|uniref:Uncharacterized protein n=1 Tax=Chaetoceros tenuissimus TaxID=426638 RepID=A0AAD3CR01_9STRA|nr:predicted protein [Chaetoceros tenuissimus]
MSKKRAYLLSVQIFATKITCRTNLYSISPKFKRQKKQSLIKWLTENVLSNSADIAWLTYTVTQFKGTIKTYQEAQKLSTKDVQTGAWRGHAPYLHLIYCILEKEDMSRAFQLSYQASSCDEVDTRATNELAVVRYWKEVATLFADQSFIPKSYMYGYLHSDFDQDIDLSAGGYDILPEKAKSKFGALKRV